LCKSNSEISRLKNRQNNNKINELTSELDDTNTRVEISKASKQIEIDNLQQKVESSSQAKKNLENQLKEAEKHIKELNRQIADAEYSTKRKKSLFSF
jgi:predicted  nucleic acid-binding Zn-ribbon protein